MNIDFQISSNDPNPASNINANSTSATNNTPTNHEVRQSEPQKTEENKKSGIESNPENEVSEANYVTELKYNKTAQLLQSITSNPLTNQVISKMPPDEFVRLKDMLKNISNGSIDKNV